MELFNPALMIFLLTFFLISVQRLPWIPIDRTAGSLIGAVLMVLFGVLPFREAMDAIDFNTIVLLLGMMIVVAYFTEAGALDFLAKHILKTARTPFQLLLLVVFASGILSALFVNDTICLVFTPILIQVVRIAKLNPLPYLIALATSANIGSAATIVGNPQNMLIATASGISFMDFFFHMFPPSLAGLIINVVLLAFFFRKDINGSTIEIGEFHSKLDNPLMIKSIAVFLLILLGFLFGESFISLPMVAISGAALLILIGNRDQSRIFARVDWTLLLFFANLFIVVYGVGKGGLHNTIMEAMNPILVYSGLYLTISFSLVTVIFSNLVSNVPFVMMMLPIADAFTGNHLWYVLAMSSTFAGNLTLVGSVANLIVAETARKQGITIGFWTYARVGIPITIATTFVGAVIYGLWI